VKFISTFVFTALLIYLPSLSANESETHFVSIDRLNTSTAYLQQVREKFIRSMASKCPIIFNAQHCSCVSAMMFDELTPIEQALIGEGFAFAQQYPGKSEREISKMIEAKFGANNLQKKDIRARWNKAQLQAFTTCKLPF